MRRCAFGITAAALLVFLCHSVSADISQDQAGDLATTYFACYFPQWGCGGVGTSVLHGSRWEAPMHLGAAGSLGGYIYVDARTGYVSCKGHPVASPAKLKADYAELEKRVREIGRQRRNRRPNKSLEPTADRRVNSF